MITKTSDSKYISIYMNPYDYDGMVKEINKVVKDKKGESDIDERILAALNHNGISIFRDFPKR